MALPERWLDDPSGGRPRAGRRRAGDLRWLTRRAAPRAQAWAADHGRAPGAGSGPRPSRLRARDRRTGAGGAPRAAGGVGARDDCDPAPPWPRAPATGPSRRSRTHERTCFERDRDRIVHSTAFRRLAGKTQVVVYPSDHQRTRLTHALEVAQVATSIARGGRGQRRHWPTPSPWATTAATGPAATPARTPSTPSSPRATTTGRGAPTSCSPR